ncbi:hypothetical protein CEXT_285581 [Caerostris extrusa]|uniref:G-protein coupled receptors family 1 profile domain-containing protein n=1 Tax=Caerostris extrusa TaxID=172846 RepID=A0AAV4Y415_CAEEX|nr:hypothetical protein CEXT_285581 [Caerostris extrusa]
MLKVCQKQVTDGRRSSTYGKHYFPLLTVPSLAGEIPENSTLSSETHRLSAPIFSAVLVCISVDRYSAIVNSLDVIGARKKGKILLRVAWTTSIISSIFEGLLFYRDLPPFIQCGNFSLFTMSNYNAVSIIFCLLTVYFIPSTMIALCYSGFFVWVYLGLVVTNKSGTICSPFTTSHYFFTTALSFIRFVTHRIYLICNSQRLQLRLISRQREEVTADYFIQREDI